jgi:hypothetical protein
VSVALCLSFSPYKICDSCEWLVTGYGKVTLSEIILLILCQIILSRVFIFYVILGGIFGGFSCVARFVDSEAFVFGFL